MIKRGNLDIVVVVAEQFVPVWHQVGATAREDQVYHVAGERSQLKYVDNLSKDIESECVQNVCAVEFLHKTYKQGAVKSAV